jgi:hypothetical protein
MGEKGLNLRGGLAVFLDVIFINFLKQVVRSWIGETLIGWLVW